MRYHHGSRNSGTRVSRLARALAVCAWFEGLNAPAAAKVTAALYQLAGGNWSGVKGVGGGVYERKIDYGPGYRVYFGKDGNTLVILLGGSSKQRQQQAIEAAQERWADYRRRKVTAKG